MTVHAGLSRQTSWYGLHTSTRSASAPQVLAWSLDKAVVAGGCSTVSWSSREPVVIGRQHRHHGCSCGRPRLLPLLVSPQAACGRAGSSCVGKRVHFGPWLHMLVSYTDTRQPPWLRQPSRQAGFGCCRWRDERHMLNLQYKSRLWRCADACTRFARAQGGHGGACGGSARIRGGTCLSRRGWEWSFCFFQSKFRPPCNSTAAPHPAGQLLDQGDKLFIHSIARTAAVSVYYV